MKLKSAFFRYVFAAAIFAGLLLLPFGLQRVAGFGFDTTFLIILAMVGCAWYLGRGPGLLIAILFEIALVYFSTPAFTTKALIVSLNRLLLFTGIVFFASTRKKAERNLRDQSELLQVTLASIGDAVIATDVEGRVGFVNPAAEILIGWRLEEIRGEHLDVVFKVINEDTHEPVEKPFEAIKREGSIVGLAKHTMLVARDGREIPIDDRGASIKDSDGNVIGTVIVFHDVSEKRKADRYREQLLERERAARLEAESANRAKDEFLATVSHELRTPLNAILGWAAMLRKTPADAEGVKNGLSIIERNARSQNEIIGDILDVSRIVSGKLEVELKPVRLIPVISSAVDSLRPAAANKAIDLETFLEGDGPLISGDAERLQQVFWNIISNAIKFTPQGGKISISLSKSEDDVTVAVRDTGIGISSEFLPSVFDRFRQVDSSMKRLHGGLGLGLAIVRNLVELQGGNVTVESAGKGLGSTFTVSFPVITASEPRSNSTAAGDNPEPLSVLAGLKILIVDDNADSAEICCMSLEEHGGKTRSVESVKKALAVFDEWKPDVLISDLGMPDLDGFDLIAKIRGLSDEDGGNIPAAALTAYARESDRERVLAAGFDLHIPKPIEGEHLASMVADLISQPISRNKASAV